MASSRFVVSVALVAAAAVGMPACSASTRPARSAGGGTATREVPVSLSVAPARGATDQPVTTEIDLRVSGADVTSVVLAKGSGAPVAGTIRADGSSWVPDGPLEYATAYTATVTATAPGGRTRTATTAFTTMRDPGSSRIGTGMYLTSGQVYGVGLPLAIEFDEEIPPQHRAGVERRLFVSSSPPQVGAWHWYGGRQVVYRPRAYWQPGTTVALRAALAGLPVGRRFVEADQTAVVSIGDPVELVIRNETKQLTAYRAGVPVRTIPVSLGKASTPSSSGRMVIMTKAHQTVFDTTREGPDGYRVTVSYAMRLTWGGEFIHAAPWSVGDQGVRNVSHGCVNVSTADAAWLFDVARVGDPVTITGTEVRLQPGNGWTAWDLDWPAFAAGSALPAKGDGPGTVRAAQPDF